MNRWVLLQTSAETISGFSSRSLSTTSSATPYELILHPISSYFRDKRTSHWCALKIAHVLHYLPWLLQYAVSYNWQAQQIWYSYKRQVYFCITVSFQTDIFKTLLGLDLRVTQNHLKNCRKMSRKVLKLDVDFFAQKKNIHFYSSKNLQPRELELRLRSSTLKYWLKTLSGRLCRILEA